VVLIVLREHVSIAAMRVTWILTALIPKKKEVAGKKEPASTVVMKVTWAGTALIPKKKEVAGKKEPASTVVMKVTWAGTALIQGKKEVEETAEARREPASTAAMKVTWAGTALIPEKKEVAVIVLKELVSIVAMRDTWILTARNLETAPEDEEEAAEEEVVETLGPPAVMADGTPALIIMSLQGGIPPRIIMLETAGGVQPLLIMLEIAGGVHPPRLQRILEKEDGAQLVRQQQMLQQKEDGVQPLRLLKIQAGVLLPQTKTIISKALAGEIPTKRQSWTMIPIIKGDGNKKLTDIIKLKIKKLIIIF
jgi:hypothetical protein